MNKLGRSDLDSPDCAAIGPAKIESQTNRITRQGPSMSGATFVCSKCGTPLRSLTETCGLCGGKARIAAGPVSDALPASLPDAAPREPLSAPPRAAAAPEPAARTATQETSRNLVGEEILKSFLDEGYEIVLIAGVGGVGKTQLLDAFKNDAFLQSIEKLDGKVQANAPGVIKCYPASVGGDKVLFLDASGEDFKFMYPSLKTGRLTEKDIALLTMISRNLRGVMLVIDLARLWYQNVNSDAADPHQVRIAAWILELLRWLQWDGRYDSKSAVEFQDQVDASVQRMRRKLNVPVQVLYSKADELSGKLIPLPPQAQFREAFQKETRKRTLEPVGEEPLHLTMHRLPDLYLALTTHAKYFRVDFAHSFYVDRQSTQTFAVPCGVFYSVGWLLGTRSRLPLLSTRFWVLLQRGLDRLSGRAERWTRLQPAREFEA